MAESDPIYIDADPGSGLPTMSAAEMRISHMGLQAGALGVGDLLVTTGAGLSIDVAAGRGFVDSAISVPQAGTRYGIYNDATKNSADFEAGGIPANGSTNPRLDAVIAQVWDDTIDGSGQRKWRLVYVAGSATAGAALGGTLPAGLSGSYILLAEVLVPGSNPASIPSANIRDRRRMARGFTTRVLATATSPTKTTSTFSTLDGFSVTREFSGAPVEVIANVEFWHNNVGFWVSLRIDISNGAVPLPGMAIDDAIRSGTSPYSNDPFLITNIQRFSPSPGWNQIDVKWATQGPTATAIWKRRQFSVRELVVPAV